MTMLWNGKVFNLSSRWVICLYTDDGQWYGKALGPGRRSPFWYDMDAVISLDGIKINDSAEWWWLDYGAVVKITSPSSSALKLEKCSLIGKLRKVSHQDVEKLGAKMYLKKDVDWGHRLD